MVEVVSTAINDLREQGDVRKREDAQRVVESKVKHFGKLDILVNAAAGNFLVSAEDLSPNGFKTVSLTALKRPSYIDNSDLIDESVPEDSTMGTELHDTLVEGTDYILLPQEVWNQLYSWLAFKKNIRPSTIPTPSGALLLLSCLRQSQPRFRLQQCNSSSCKLPFSIFFSISD
ncbi:peroxisomal 2 4-dienoyl-coa reductase [Phtheirospermum japonicum]|uniref:Peroxisomal 2 4-dienoyl-coa reductase n=1 Tax=Phtheirospermum japonicum TaxID=374723 RepID=A0A830CV92_9LAMI|nr:peroxisomal 2 4-dienoyl-coa reductase [Phtheirospermum japonicum]